MRYFHISYSAEGATGSCTMTVKNFINHKEFKEQIKEWYPNLRKVNISSWVEMTEEDYLIFIGG